MYCLNNMKANEILEQKETLGKEDKVDYKTQVAESQKKCFEELKKLPATESASGEKNLYSKGVTI